jgi:ribokinase
MTDGPVVVLGSLNVDLVARMDRVPGPGETIAGSRLERHAGGKGLNQAVAAARLGADVVMLGSVGPDAAAEMLLNTLADNGVRIDDVLRSETQTGSALVLLEASGENRIIVIGGANASTRALPRGWREIIEGAGLLVMQLEVPLELVAAAARCARQAGVPVMLNPSPATPLPDDLLADVTILVINETEAAAIGIAAASGVPHVITTLGARGAVYRGPDGDEVHVPAPTVQVVDTTGAGDAFTGALADAWIRGESPATSVGRACAAGALAVGTVGATGSPNASELARFLDGAPSEVTASANKREGRRIPVDTRDA